MKVVLLCKDVDFIKLTIEEAEEFVNNITEREIYNRTLRDGVEAIIKKVKSSNESIVELRGEIFENKKFRSHPTLIYIIDKHIRHFNDNLYRIEEIPCNYFDINKKRGAEVISYPDMSKWTECYIQDPAW